MAAKATKTENEGIETLNTALSNSEKWIAKNRKFIYIAVIGVVVIVSGVLLYRNFVSAPKEKEAAAQIFTAERYMQQDSLNLALNGDGNRLGFLQIIDLYGGTTTGNLARYYAGLCYRDLGRYEEAIVMLREYSATDEMLAPLAFGALGDCYAQQGDNVSAKAAWERAAGFTRNPITTPLYLMKLGALECNDGNWQAAAKRYEAVTLKFPNSQEASEAIKLKAHAEAKMAQATK